MPAPTFLWPLAPSLFPSRTTTWKKSPTSNHGGKSINSPTLYHAWGTNPLKRVRRTREEITFTAKKRRLGPGQPPHKPTEQLRDIVKGMALACIQPARIAEIIKISTPTLLKYYGEEVEGAKERLLSKAARTIYNLLDENNLGAACFVLKTQGKPYGWTERHEVTGKDGDPLLPSLDKLTDEQIRQLTEARRVVSEIAPEITRGEGDRAASPSGSTRIH